MKNFFKKIYEKKKDALYYYLGIEDILRIQGLIKDVYIPAAIQHREVFPQFKGIYKNHDVVVVGTGPTLEKYKEIDSAVHIGVNYSYKCMKKLDYWFCNDYVDPDVFKAIFEMKDTVKFLGVHYQDLSILIPEYIREYENTYSYYFESTDLTLQEKYKNGSVNLLPLDLSISPFKISGTTLHCAFEFALWTHPRRIYLVGADCNNAGHAKKAGYNEGNSYEDFSGLIDQWKQIAKFSKQYYPDVEVMSINPVGLKGVFHDIYM